jgi:hypothetical protein
MVETRLDSGTPLAQTVPAWSGARPVWVQSVVAEQSSCGRGAAGPFELQAIAAHTTARRGSGFRMALS